METVLSNVYQRLRLNNLNTLISLSICCLFILFSFFILFPPPLLPSSVTSQFLSSSQRLTTPTWGKVLSLEYIKPHTLIGKCYQPSSTYMSSLMMRVCNPSHPESTANLPGCAPGHGCTIFGRFHFEILMMPLPSVSIFPTPPGTLFKTSVGFIFILKIVYSTESIWTVGFGSKIYLQKI